MTVTARADALPTGGAGDELTVAKAEQHVSVAGGSTATATLGCAAGSFPSDAAFRLDATDQGAGAAADVAVLGPTLGSDGRYTVEVRNGTTGQAQGKLLVVCLPQRTTGGRALVVSAPVEVARTLPAGRATVPVACDAGQIAIAPSVRVVSGTATVAASVPDGLAGRVLHLDVAPAGATVTVSVRCLSPTTTAVDRRTATLSLRPVTQPVTVPAGARRDVTVSCGDAEKGIVAGWRLDDGLHALGNDPQPKVRVFRLDNPGGVERSGTLHLLCLGVRTVDGSPASRTVTNTATVTTTATAGPGSVLGDTATVQVLPPTVGLRSARRTATGVTTAVSCRRACRGRVEVRTTAGRRLAARPFRASRARTVTVRLRVPRRHRTVRVVVRDVRGRTVASRIVRRAR
ncbi:hypothetical protein GKE82_02735 [Conexibacter sp. W3-3-2]|uniref:hypothetical protein n=1 Tax=Conexibacter sp. W3-3-2 TaxID=2675227 RepID=UPI0012B8E317|nr:hypothetical protein [Conexibacter sp. W3-3-2]MTD43249.1 hypothetical protein [Conexibacter sp. W3-3-2]